jgi:hypothetical protein
MSIMFQSQKAVFLFPSIHGGDVIEYPARRNSNPTGTVAKPLAKAVCTALMGHVQVAMGNDHAIYLEIKSASKKGKVHQLGLDRANNVWCSPNGVTYHLGLIALAEALVRKQEAPDLLDAWEELLIYFGGKVQSLIRTTEARRLILHAADELYFWMRYGPL